jgi:hypothetical protein
MMNLRPDETDLVGTWTFDGKQVRGDEACERIAHLTEHVLDKLGVSREYGAWETLFRDPADGRLWERTYPNSGWHGGGPPRLRVVSDEEARAKYDF